MQEFWVGILSDPKDFPLLLWTETGAETQEGSLTTSSITII